MADVASITDLRKDFPTLEIEVNGKPLIYLDNGATAQKPQQVIDAVQKYYQYENANIHRGVHYLSQEATGAYEAAREKIQRFLNAAHSKEIIFTKGTTDSINLVAQTYPFQPGDEILISAMEHHSNIVPWQMACERTGAVLKVIPINEKGELKLDEGLALLTEQTKMLALIHVSNAMGTINPIDVFIKKARKVGAHILIDGAQAVPHQSVDVTALDCDFYTFSAHKLFGPTGVGVLYGKANILDSLPPYQGGGDMIKTVSFEKTTYNTLPHKFEAGTPHISGGIGLGAAIDYINAVGYETIIAQEQALLTYANTKLKAINGLRIIGDNDHKAAVISFVIDGTHPYDLGMILDKLGIAVRTGHHCAQPLMDIYQISGTCRASFAFYNTIEEVDILADGITRALHMLR